MANIATCSCGDGSSIQNYGLPSCFVGVDVPERAIFLSQKKVDGSVNGIDLVTDTLNQAFFDARFKDESEVNRWLLMDDIVDFISDPADPNTEDFPDGRISKLSEGIRGVTWTVIVADPYKYKAKVEAMDCREISVMYIDRNGSLVGQTQAGTDNFIGRQIQANSLNVKVFGKTDATSNKVEVSFNYDRKASDNNVDFIEESSLGGYSLDSAEPLQDVNVVFGATLVASVTFDLELDFGGAKNRNPAGGLTDTHLEIYNVTTDSVEALASLVEAPLGTYTATYSVPVSVPEVIEVRGITELYVQLGYDLKNLKNTTSVTTV
jgi:hypothetical protein